MTFTTVTQMGDEETFSTLERAAEVAATIAVRSGWCVDVVDDAIDEITYVAVPR